MNSTVTMLYPDKFSECTLLIIPWNFYDAHSSLFPKKVAEYNKGLHTRDKEQWTQLWQCTILINLVDAHSSLFHRLNMMHTPHYSQGRDWLWPGFTHSCQCTDFNFHYARSWYIYWMHTPHYSITFIWCTLPIIPKEVDAHSSLFPKQWLSQTRIYTLLARHSELNFDNALSW